ncbi:MAG: DNA primase [bacterium JZ-2024 1]
MPGLRAISAEALKKLDASQIFGRYLSLRPAGASLKALCPFHPEKTPSFNINPTNKLWHCFGCGKGGNAIRFIVEIEKISPLDAVRKLAEWAGIPFVVEDEREEEESARTSLYHLLRFATHYYRNILYDSTYGKRVLEEFLKSRGILMETAKEFDLGLSSPSPRALTQYALENGFSPEVLVSSGLSYYKLGVLVDRLAGRLIFPIHSVSGDVIAFAGRVLAESDAPKYINTSDSPVFRKGQVLYNLGRARGAIQHAGSVILVEGYMDVIGLHQVGIRNVVASMGTSLTPQQVNRLVDFSDRIYIAYDADSAGEAATQRSIEAFLERKVTPLIVQLPEGKDPDDVARESGAQGWNQLLESALTFPAFRLHHLAKTYHPDTPEGKERILNGLFETLTRYEDPLYQKPYLVQAAHVVGLKPDAVQRRFRRFSTSLRSRESPVPGMDLGRFKMSLSTGDYFIGFLLHHPEFLSPPVTDLDAETTFPDPVLQRIFRTLVAHEVPDTRRLVEELYDDTEATERIAHLLHSPLIQHFSREDPGTALRSLLEALGVTRMDFVVQGEVSSLLAHGAEKDPSSPENMQWLRSAMYEIVRHKLGLMGHRKPS